MTSPAPLALVPPRLRCPAVSLNTTESAQIMLDLVRANVGSDDLAIDYLERATAILIQELRLARKLRRGRR